jgi:serine/threonine protein kinase
MEKDPKSKHLMNACPSCNVIMDVSSCDPYSKVICPECSTAMRVRADFLHFRIEKKIGEGGLSRVFRAVDQTLDRLVALKILNPDFSKDEERAFEFEKEAKITASISHPNVVKVFSAGSDQDHYFMAMELVGGGSLDEMIHLEGKLSEKKVLNLGSELVQGMNAAHAAGLIHRDIKPGNILFSEEGTSKIVDFGLARSELSKGSETGQMWATPYYVPPEKLYGSKEDFRSDVYSLGATLFHALAGEPPCSSDTPSIEELKLLKQRKVSLEMSAPHVSVSTCELIDRMMERDPNDRHDSYQDLAAHFSKARNKLSQSSVLLVNSGSLRINNESREGKLINGRAVMGIGVLAVLLGIIFFWNGITGDPSNGNVGANEAEEVQIVKDGNKSTTEKFQGAIKMMEMKAFGSAERVFGEIASSGETRQPTSNWALFNQGLSLLLQGDLKRSGVVYKRLKDKSNYSDRNEDKKLCVFYTKISNFLSLEKPVRLDNRARFGDNSFESLALLAIGVHNWELGAFDEAEGYFLGFSKQKIPQNYDWINGFKELTEPYLSDLVLLRKFPVVDRQSNFKEMNSALQISEEILSRTETERVREHMRGRVEILREVSLRLKDEEKEAEKLRMSKLRLEELEKMFKMKAEVKEYTADYQFNKGLNVIGFNKFRHPDFIKIKSDYVEAWESAEAFINNVIVGINRYGYYGPVKMKNGSVRNLNIVSADRDQFVHMFGAAQGKASVQIDQVTGLSLRVISKSFAKNIKDKKIIEERLKEKVFFSYLTGELAVAATLSAEITNDLFRELWARIRKAERRS